MEVLETITRIAKYSNLQITNDWSWIEVEVENKIIEMMMQEESEVNKNEINRAKANNSMPTAHLPSPSSFH